MKGDSVLNLEKEILKDNFKEFCILSVKQIHNSKHIFDINIIKQSLN